MPASVEVGGRYYPINTDFRAWFCFQKLLQDKNALYGDFDFLYTEDKPQDRLKGFEALYNFYNIKREIPRPTNETNDKVLDYEQDAELIYSAFIEQYNIDLMATDKDGHFIPLHWHKFQALLFGLHNTKLNDVMQMRCWKRPNGKLTDYDKEQQKLYNAWKLPQPTDEQAKKQLEEFNALFK